MSLLEFFDRCDHNAHGDASSFRNKGAGHPRVVPSALRFSSALRTERARPPDLPLRPPLSRDIVDGCRPVCADGR